MGFESIENKTVQECLEEAKHYREAKRFDLSVRVVIKDNCISVILGEEQCYLEVLADYGRTTKISKELAVKLCNELEIDESDTAYDFCEDVAHHCSLEGTSAE